MKGKRNYLKKDKVFNVLVSGSAIDDPENIINAFDSKLEKTKKFKNRSVAIWTLMRDWINAK